MYDHVANSVLSYLQLSILLAVSPISKSWVEICSDYHFLLFSHEGLNLFPILLQDTPDLRELSLMAHSQPAYPETLFLLAVFANWSPQPGC
jgi:hypothetical protein